MKSLHAVVASIFLAGMMMLNTSCDDKDTDDLLKSISLKNGEYIVWEGEVSVSEYVVNEDDLLLPITWHSSDPNVIKVEGGKMSVAGPGKAVVTASVDGYESEGEVTFVVPLAGMNNFSRGEVTVYMIGSGTATFDWADGSEPETVTLQGDNGISVTHDYGGVSVDRQILITGGAGATSLTCNSMQLTRMRLSTNPKLTYLSFMGNEISESDFQTGLCSALTYLDYSFNTLNITAEKFPAITYLNCANNYLTGAQLNALWASLPVYEPEEDGTPVATFVMSGNSSEGFNGYNNPKGWGIVND